MLPRAVTARVAYVPGTGFFADGFGSRQLRLSYCYPTPERIREGVRRLAGVLEAELDLHADVRQRGAAPTVDPGSAGPVAGHHLSPATCAVMTDADADAAHVHRAPHPARRAGGTAERTVAVLAGGLSHERDVSLRSGRRCRRRCAASGSAVREWDADAALLGGCATEPPDAVVVALHGGEGEDGACGRSSSCSVFPTSARRRRPAGSRGTSRSPRSMARAGLDTPDWVALPHATFRELGAGRCWTRWSPGSACR